MFSLERLRLLTSYETWTPSGTAAVRQAWDQENRLTQGSAADGTVSAHVYSGDGLRQYLQGILPGGAAPTSLFVWDGYNAACLRSVEPAAPPRTGSSVKIPADLAADR